jgi:thiamine-phosphate pyrophosphorylase
MQPSPIDRLSRAARLLHRRAGAPPSLPHLLFLTDPTRTPNPAAAAMRLPRGAGVIHRSFGAPDRLREARLLRRICRRRGLLLLIGADAALARRVGADGLHVPERAWRGRPALKLHRVTTAAHSPRALRRAARLGADAALLSPVLPSASPSAGQALGQRTGRAWAAGCGAPVYALGGVRAGRVPVGRFCGVAAVEALAGRPPRT